MIGYITDVRDRGAYMEITVMHTTVTRRLTVPRARWDQLVRERGGCAYCLSDPVDVLGSGPTASLSFRQTPPASP